MGDHASKADTESVAQRLLTDAQYADLIDQQEDDIVSDPYSYAKDIIDQLTEEEILQWIEESKDE